MFHVDIIPIVTCFASTSYHFYTFFGTNLLTRCHSASFCFLLFLYFRKAVKEIFSELDENQRRSLFQRHVHGVQRGDGGALGGGHTRARRGPTLGRALLWCGSLGAPPQVPSGLRKLPDLLFMEEKISSDSEDIFRVGFLKPKTAGNTELALWHLVNRLVPENA